MAEKDATKPRLVKVTIDGHETHVPEGTPLLQAAIEIGRDVPYFCWHPGLSVVAQCRQCLVEVEGQPRLQPACQLPCTEGLRVITSSERVLRARQQMLEFTLLNHPVDCPICDKSGECLLQKLYLQWDRAASRLDMPKVRKPKVVDIGPHIVLDAERCILCTRCIRVCREVAGVDQLTMAYRGNRQVLTTAPGQRLDNPYSLCTVDVCPVGALTSKDFRFAMRAWELSATPSICPGCATGCNVEFHHSRGRLYRVVPRLSAEVNRYWMCDEGRFTYKEVHRARLATPRVIGTHASWEQALEAATNCLRPLISEAPQAIGVVLSAELTNEDALAAMTLAETAGLSRFYMTGRPSGTSDTFLMHADKNPNSAGIQAIVGPGLLSKETLVKDLQSGSLAAAIFFGNPRLNTATEAALRRIKCIVFTPHNGPLVECADVAFPVALFAEIEGTFTNARGLVQRVRSAVPPPRGAKPLLTATDLLRRRMGFGPGFASSAEAFSALKQRVSAFASADFGPELPTVQLRFLQSRG